MSLEKIRSKSPALKNTSDHFKNSGSNYLREEKEGD